MCGRCGVVELHVWRQAVVAQLETATSSTASIWWYALLANHNYTAVCSDILGVHQWKLYTYSKIGISTLYLTKYLPTYCNATLLLTFIALDFYFVRLKRPLCNLLVSSFYN